MVVDVVGFFLAPFVQPLECTVVSTAFSIAASTFTFYSATCPAGYTATGAGLADGGSGPGVEYRELRVNTTTPAEDISFVGWNGSGSIWGGACQAICCRIPGR